MTGPISVIVGDGPNNFLLVKRTTSDVIGVTEFVTDDISFLNHCYITYLFIFCSTDGPRSLDVCGIHPFLERFCPSRSLVSLVEDVRVGRNTLRSQR